MRFGRQLYAIVLFLIALVVAVPAWADEPDTALPASPMPSDTCCPDACCPDTYSGCLPKCCYCCCTPYVPNMIGDGGLLQPRIIVAGSRVFCMQEHAWKVSENNSAVPQDRVGFNYNRLQDVIIGHAAGQPGHLVTENVDEYRFLMEKTFFDGRMSVELMIPFYNTSKYHINNLDEYLEGPQLATAFGDIAFGFKWLARCTECSAWSLGLRIETPTTPNTWIQPWPSFVRDDIWHFTPYIAAQFTPNECWFANFFGSYRFNSTTLSAQTDELALGTREATYLMVDASIGRWLFHDPCNAGITGLASVLELHYTTTPSSASAYTYHGIPATDYFLGHTDYLNMTVGLSTVWKERSSVSAGFVFPLRYNDSVIGPTDRNYDWAFMLHVNIGMGR